MVMVLLLITRPNEYARPGATHARTTFPNTTRERATKGSKDGGTIQPARGREHRRVRTQKALQRESTGSEEPARGGKLAQREGSPACYMTLRAGRDGREAPPVGQERVCAPLR